MNPSSLLTTGGVKIGPSLYFAKPFTACARSSGVKSISAVSVAPCRSKTRGLVGDGEVGENRRSRHVEIPQRVVHELVVPLALASLQIHGDDRVGEEIVPGAMA